jgi:hypothetical protein
MFKIGKDLNDGTYGFRFKLLKVDGLYRKRSIKKRYGLSSGATTTGIHFGLRSVYLEKKKTYKHFSHTFIGM